ncbi:MAG: LamB/YcsF family protein [Fimbriimonas sp.]|nr:LamB/YcsF family protein [Fimbriimonas sp.]
MKVSQIVGKKTIDLNVDIGEGFPFDRDLLSFASSANICCGAHAGSSELTLQTVELCRQQRVRIGVHPGYPDRGSMGRSPMQSGQEREYLKSIFDQVKRFLEIVRPEYLKPHGAFYGDTAILLPDNWRTAVKQTPPPASAYEASGLYLAQFSGVQSLVLLLRIHRLPLMGLHATAHREIAARAGTQMVKEGFGDRGYLSNGTLIPRGHPGAMLSDRDAIREQVLRLAPHVDSICLHGDTPNCVEYAEMVFQTLVDAGYGVGA